MLGDVTGYRCVITVGWLLNSDGGLEGYAVSCVCGFRAARLRTMAIAESVAQRHRRDIEKRRGVPRRKAAGAKG